MKNYMTVVYEIPDSDVARAEASDIIQQMVTPKMNATLNVVSVSLDNEINRLAIIEDFVLHNVVDDHTLEKILSDVGIGDTSTMTDWENNQ